MKSKTIPALALLTVSLGGCVTAQTGYTPQLDHRFGSAVLQARAQQTINPDASSNTDPVAGIGGEAARRTLDRYEKTFETPPPVVNVINIGGSISGGGGQ